MAAASSSSRKRVRSAETIDEEGRTQQVASAVTGDAGHGSAPADKLRRTLTMMNSLERAARTLCKETKLLAEKENCSKEDVSAMDEIEAELANTFAKFGTSARGMIFDLEFDAEDAACI